MSTARRPDDRLRDHADRLLTGTGLTLDTAAELAADPAVPSPPPATAAAAALREGWGMARATTPAVTPAGPTS